VFPLARSASACSLIFTWRKLSLENISSILLEEHGAPVHCPSESKPRLRARATACVRLLTSNPAISTVPAINLRTLAYDTARVLFNLKREQHIVPLIMELARSEMAYTNQRYDEFAVVVLAAAMKEGYRGPVFLQADHVHAKSLE
jgi:hypothetical protein